MTKSNNFYVANRQDGNPSAGRMEPIEETPDVLCATGTSERYEARLPVFVKVRQGESMS